MRVLQPRTRTRTPARSRRRGVTLVEMLVTVALLILMMTVIVQIFQAATGAVTAAKAYQELDDSLRQLDSTIRQDLMGVTATLTPPLNPNDNKGYFEYDENEFADLQGEDSDDILRFTAKAPPGQFFTGRAWVGGTVMPSPPFAAGTPPPGQPMMVSSQYAEIIYFLRNGNLYRRVLLVAPERQASLLQTNVLLTSTFGKGTLLGWQGVNDISARPLGVGVISTLPSMVANTLGDLTNRENRYGLPRFTPDLVTHGTPAAIGPDGITDDENDNGQAAPNQAFVGDTVPDYYQTLYPKVFTAVPQRVFEINSQRAFASYDALAFPFIFPGAYTNPDPFSANNGLGWIHSLNPDWKNMPVATLGTPNSAGTANTLYNINHNPIDVGDSLALPSKPQTWWGLPTWRETLSPFWTDPWFRIAQSGNTPNTPTAPSQPNGLSPFNPTLSATPPWGSMPFNVLPPMTIAFRPQEQPNTDGLGSAKFASPANLWADSWEDDLVMTGVRSFDVKAYDNAYSGYVDLGWGDDLRLYLPFNAAAVNPVGAGSSQSSYFLTSTPPAIMWPPAQSAKVAGNATAINNPVFDTINQSFAHEGRIPPRVNDLRADSQFPAIVPNVGDDQSGVIRLRRVWDTWSTTYSRAPATGIHPGTQDPIGPPFTLPIYPSYPPPYPAPMRGLRIQIRVTDPRNERIKTLTIVQDFSDKLN